MTFASSADKCWYYVVEVVTMKHLLKIPADTPVPIVSSCSTRSRSSYLSQAKKVSVRVGHPCKWVFGHRRFAQQVCTRRREDFSSTFAEVSWLAIAHWIVSHACLDSWPLTKKADRTRITYRLLSQKVCAVAVELLDHMVSNRLGDNCNLV